MSRHRLPETTLIVGSSVDGCLVGAESISLDPNPKWKRKKRVAGYVQQFFDFSTANNDTYNVVSADTLLLIGVNDTRFIPKRSRIRLIVIDKLCQLSTLGISHITASVEDVILIRGVPTTQQTHQSIPTTPPNVKEAKLADFADLKHLFYFLRSSWGVVRVTIHAAGVDNAKWIQAGVVQYLTVVVYPLLVSSNGTPFLRSDSLFSVKPVELITIQSFDKDYLFLRYRVKNN